MFNTSNENNNNNGRRRLAFSVCELVYEKQKWYFLLFVYYFVY